MKNPLGVTLVLIALTGCVRLESVDMNAARKLSDEFMADWIAHRSESAFDKMEPEFKRLMTRSDFGQQMEKLSQYCGWPQDSDFKEAQNGFKIYENGNKKFMRKFLYAATTSQFPKGQCFFSVSVVPSEGTVKVTAFGPFKVRSGNPIH